MRLFLLIFFLLPIPGFSKDFEFNFKGLENCSNFTLSYSCFGQINFENGAIFEGKMTINSEGSFANEGTVIWSDGTILKGYFDSQGMLLRGQIIISGNLQIVETNKIKMQVAKIKPKFIDGKLVELNPPEKPAYKTGTEWDKIECTRGENSYSNGYVPIAVKWDEIKNVCNSLAKSLNWTYFEEKNTIAYCEYYEQVFDVRLKADRHCSAQGKKGADYESFASNVCLNLSQIKCIQSEEDIRKINEEKVKEKQKNKIDKLKQECEILGFKEGSKKFKQCVMELM